MLKMKQDLKNNPNIKLGDADIGISDEEINNHKNTKVRITTYIDGDVYDELQRRAEAGEASGKYQRLMNDLLRLVLFDVPFEKMFPNAVISSGINVKTTIERLVSESLQRHKKEITDEIIGQVWATEKKTIKATKKRA